MTTLPVKTLVCASSSWRSASASMFMGLALSAFSAWAVMETTASAVAKARERSRLFMEGTFLAYIVVKQAAWLDCTVWPKTKKPAPGRPGGLYRTPFNGILSLEQQISADL